MRTHALPHLILALLVALATPARAVDRPDPARFEPEIRVFETADSLHPVPRGAIVFYGSSSIRMWHPRLAADFPGRAVVGRGFGGSTMGEAVHFAPRVVRPLAPAAVVVYEGDNDIEMGLTSDQVLADFDSLLARFDPPTRVYVLALKPSEARWERWPLMRETNKRLAARCRKERKRLTYVDIATPMLGADGRPRPELFLPDRLHLSAAGYDLWRSIVRPALLTP